MYQKSLKGILKRVNSYVVLIIFSAKLIILRYKWLIFKNKKREEHICPSLFSKLLH